MNSSRHITALMFFVIVMLGVWIPSRDWLLSIEVAILFVIGHLIPIPRLNLFKNICICASLAAGRVIDILNSGVWKFSSKECHDWSHNESSIKLISREARKHRRQIHFASKVAKAHAIICLGLMATFYRLFLPDLKPVGKIIVLAAAALGLPSILILIISGRKWNLLIQKLIKSDDLRTVGPLLEALEWYNLKTRLEVESRLVTLLSGLHPDVPIVLDNTQRKILYHSLLNCNYPLILAILGSFNQLGDVRGVPYLRKLASRGCKGEIDRLVRDSARECLLNIEKQISDNQSNSTLLRSSSTPASSEILLRASKTEDNDHHSDQLLRPQERRD